MSTNSTSPISGQTGVTILTTSFPRFHGDNAGRFVCNFARELNQMGVKMRVIAPHDSAVVENTHPFPVEYFRYFSPESWQTLAYGAGIASRLKNNFIRIFQLPFFLLSFFFSALKNSRQTQIFHAYWMFAGLVAIAVKCFTSIPVVINLFGSDILFLKIPVIWSLLCKILNRADAIVCESQHFADQLIAKGISKEIIHICSWGIDLEQFKPCVKLSKRKSLQLPKELPLILAVGNLSERKGHKYLLGSLPKILNDFGPVKVIIVGEGDFRGCLEKMIADLNLEQHVRLMGFQKEETIPNWLNTADIFILSSLLEGTPNILLEAMACRLPVVTTDVGGIGNVVKNGYNGIIIPPRSESKLAEAVISLLQDPDLRERLAAKAENTVNSDFGSWKTQASILKNLYSQILKLQDHRNQI
jgi:glycosyltransferase involved in cell wall biosynthesis